MDVFSGSEILQFAKKIEENGEKFYRQFADTMKEEKAKALFEYLAQEEVKHKKTFEDMLSKVENYKPAESYSEEYFTYLRAYVDDVIFADSKLEGEAMGVRDVLSALDFGLRRETESIFYYSEVRKFVPEEQQKIIDAIIDEERTHFTKLHQLKKFFADKV